MGRKRHLVAAVAAVLGLTACGGTTPQEATDPVDPFVASLRGTWWECPSTATDSRYVATIITGPATGTELQYSQVVNEYAVAACAGTPTSTRVEGSGTIHVGPGVVVDLDGSRVTARRIDLTGTLTGVAATILASHDIAYLRTDVTPARLYLGWKAYGLDGSTTEARPIQLWPMAWLIRD